MRLLRWSAAAGCGSWTRRRDSGPPGPVTAALLGNEEGRSLSSVAPGAPPSSAASSRRRSCRSAHPPLA